MTEEAEKRATGFLGICMRAGQLLSGQEACVDAVRREAARIVLLDEAASPNTLKRLRDACRTHGVPLYALSAGTLGRRIGREGRVVVALNEGGMAEKLLELVKDEPRL